jgi:hypothetical protein
VRVEADVENGCKERGRFSGSSIPGGLVLMPDRVGRRARVLHTD